jgi:hypothetical protein
VSDLYIGRLLMPLTVVAIIALEAGGGRLYWLVRMRWIQRRELRGFEIRPSTQRVDQR